MNTMTGVLTWNVHGLVNPIKIKCILATLRQYQIQTAMLQETHLKSEELNRLKRGRFELITASLYQKARKRGTAILFHKPLRYCTEATMIDTDGGY